MLIQPASEVDRQLRQRQIPVLYRVRLALRCLQHTGVYQLRQTVFVPEAAFGLGQLVEMSMHGLARVGRANRGAHIIWVFKIGRQRLPLAVSGLNHHRVFLAPFGIQLI
jgi:hypothetical protein